MKKLFVPLSLLILSGNISIFFLGLYQHFSTENFYKNIKLKLLENSAISIANHLIDEYNFNDSILYEFMYDDSKIIIFLKKQNSNLILDIEIHRNNKKYTSSYIYKL